MSNDPLKPHVQETGAVQEIRPPREAQSYYAATAVELQEIERRPGSTSRRRDAYSTQWPLSRDSLHHRDLRI